MEKVKIDAIENMAEAARLELECLRTEREEENTALLTGRAAVEVEMEVLSQLRRDMEQQLQIFMSNKMEISFERKRIEELRKETESENQGIACLQYEQEVEKKALSMARISSVSSFQELGSKQRPLHPSEAFTLLCSSNSWFTSHEMRGTKREFNPKNKYCSSKPFNSNHGSSSPFLHLGL
ncbi:hypothetical protein NE237_000292 [Protea cynaroides]|uniref:Uncharacterized protein n=1 Tax=Protea cynaroides TaxID=273540 RepID=A0A9Q0KRZ2_9MAGN|nr:hypothetical protein NE237_000292 [Protea cynaroides]